MERQQFKTYCSFLVSKFLIPTPLREWTGELQELFQKLGKKLADACRKYFDCIKEKAVEVLSYFSMCHGIIWFYVLWLFDRNGKRN